MTGYPADRPRFFAHRFVRVLHKSCAGQDIGLEACYLLCIIAHTEDAARYSGPVRFWNSQLAETMGFRSPKQLNAARDKAIKAGWLHYARAHDRAVGEYFVMIPERYAGLSDSPIEPSCSDSRSDFGTESGTGNGMDNGTGNAQERPTSRNGNVLLPGKPSCPIPLPNPSPIPAEDCVEPAAPDSTPTDDSPVVMEFPCSGTPKTWVLRQSKVDEWRESFPAVDIVSEVRKAKQWCLDNPTRRKTARGMPAFLGRWISREQDRGGSREKNTKPSTRARSAAGYDYDPADDMEFRS